MTYAAYFNNQDHGIGITADNAYAGLASQYHVSSTALTAAASHLLCCSCHTRCSVLLLASVSVVVLHTMLRVLCCSFANKCIQLSVCNIGAGLWQPGRV
jgi:hypothetical protein